MITTSGLASRHDVQRLLAVGGRADDLDAVQGARAAPPARRARSGGRRPRRPHGCSLLVLLSSARSSARAVRDSGSQARTTVPPVAGQAIVGPPAELGRPLAQRHQAHPGLHVGRDADTVVGTSTSSSSPTHSQADVALVADACRTTLVSASPAMRYAATSTAADRWPRSPASTGRRARRCSIRSACWRSAPTRPRSSSAGGRRSCTSRRTSATTSCTSALVAAIDRWACSGSRGTRRRADSSWNTTPLERRPEPVVQVAADPTALLLAGDDQALPVVLELVGELAGADCRRGLPHQVGEQLLVASAQPAARRRGPAARTRPTSRPR